MERLRAQIREVVIAVLRKGEAQPARIAAAPAGKSAIILFTSDQVPADSFFADIATLAAQGYRLLAAPSYTFSQFHGSQLAAKLPKGSIILSDADEIQQRETIRTADALVAPFVSTNTTAKVAQGIEDSAPSRLIRNMLLQGKPVCVAADLPAHHGMIRESAPGIPPALLRVAEDHLHTLQQMGVRFIGGNVAGCVTEILKPHVNETPERLARNKAPKKREFITAEDVWNAISRGQKELLYLPGTVLTDEAREYAASRGIVLREK